MFFVFVFWDRVTAWLYWPRLAWKSWAPGPSSNPQSVELYTDGTVFSWKCLHGEVMTSCWVLCFLEAHCPFPVLFSLIKYLLKIYDWNQTFHICKYFHLNSEGMAFRKNSFPDPITGLTQWQGMLGYPCQRWGRLLISPTLCPPPLRWRHEWCR